MNKDTFIDAAFAEEELERELLIELKELFCIDNENNHVQILSSKCFFIGEGDCGDDSIYLIVRLILASDQAKEAFDKYIKEDNWTNRKIESDIGIDYESKGILYSIDRHEFEMEYDIEENSFTV